MRFFRRAPQPYKGESHLNGSQRGAGWWWHGVPGKSWEMPQDAGRTEWTLIIKYKSGLMRTILGAEPLKTGRQLRDHDVEPGMSGRWIVFAGKSRLRYTFWMRGGSKPGTKEIYFHCCCCCGGMGWVAAKAESKTNYWIIYKLTFSAARSFVRPRPLFERQNE